MVSDFLESLLAHKSKAPKTSRTSRREDKVGFEKSDYEFVDSGQIVANQSRYPFISMFIGYQLQIPYCTASFVSFDFTAKLSLSTRRSDRIPNYLLFS